ncbi:hypothetical protein LEP1GSC037_4730 [Leptospira interrogans str. 2006001854]|uniref:Uncharacterized protein n=1 Tax=Leptospira interrogans str. 2006001854 TaxID=1001590 RepID=M6GSK8_LEPIR|nr:hypothetical protein LEP1GSC037_4730 [Leptospira interrogans str. 2006001854]
MFSKFQNRTEKIEPTFVLNILEKRIFEFCKLSNGKFLKGKNLKLNFILTLI